MRAIRDCSQNRNYSSAIRKSSISRWSRVSPYKIYILYTVIRYIDDMSCSWRRFRYSFWVISDTLRYHIKLKISFLGYRNFKTSLKQSFTLMHAILIMLSECILVRQVIPTESSLKEIEIPNKVMPNDHNKIFLLNRRTFRSTMAS